MLSLRQRVRLPPLDCDRHHGDDDGQSLADHGVLRQDFDESWLGS